MVSARVLAHAFGPLTLTYEMKLTDASIIVTWSAAPRMTSVRTYRRLTGLSPPLPALDIRRSGGTRAEMGSRSVTGAGRRSVRKYLPFCSVALPGRHRAQWGADLADRLSAGAGHAGERR
jgi:hypothetical protein